MRQRILTLVITGSILSGLAGAPVNLAAQTVAAPQVAAPAPSRPAAAEESVFDDLLGHTIRDFRRIPSAEAATILSVGGVGAVFATRWDRTTTSTLSGATELDSVFSAGQTLGGAHVQMAGALATYTVGRLTTNARVRTLGADLFRAQLMTQAVTHAIKLAVGRGRPDGTQYSFPSGHSATTFATAAVLQRHLGWRAGVPAYALAAYVATSRLQEKRHFLSDVAFGAALGIVAGRSVTIGRGETKFAVSPLAAAGGGGINFTLLPKD